MANSHILLKLFIIQYSCVQEKCFCPFLHLFFDIRAVFTHVPNVYLHKEDINRHLLLSKFIHENVSWVLSGIIGSRGFPSGTVDICAV